MKKVSILIAGGVLLFILAVIASIPAFTGSEETLLTGEDFGPREGGGYMATVPADRLETTVNVKVEGKNGQAIRLNILIMDGEDDILINYTDVTPFDASFDLYGSDLGSYSFILNITKDHTLTDLNIEMTQNELSSIEAFLCCGALLLVPLSFLLTMTGLIMLIIDRMKARKKRSMPMSAPVRERGVGGDADRERRSEIVIDPYRRRPEQDEGYKRPRMAPPPPTG